jgi:hypothetical protein
MIRDELGYLLGPPPNPRSWLAWDGNAPSSCENSEDHPAREAIHTIAAIHGSTATSNTMSPMSHSGCMRVIQSMAPIRRERHSGTVAVAWASVLSPDHRYRPSRT